MTRSDTLWDVFRATGYIGAYLLYRHSLEPMEDFEVKETVNDSEVRGVAGI